MAIKIDLKGCCVTREAFSYNEENDIAIDKYWFQKPLVAISSSPLDVDIDYINKIKVNLINENLTEFIVRERTQSLRKEFFNDYNKADYLLIDLIDERMTLMKLNDNTYIEYIPNIFKLLKNDFKISIVKNDFLLFKEACDKFFNELLKYYNEEEIILHKAYAVTKVIYENTEYKLEEFFVEKDEKVRNYYSNHNANEFNKFFAQCYKYILERWPKIKVIEIEIEKTLLDIDHRLGKSFFHYDEEYYRLFLKQLKDIIYNKHNEEVVKRISDRNYDFIQNITHIENSKKINNKEVEDSERTKIIHEYIDGKLTEIAHYQNDELKKREIYYLGEKKEENYYFKELLTGKKYLYPNGKYSKIINYSEFSPLDKVHSEEYFTEKGKRYDYKVYYSTGELSMKNIYNDNGLVQKKKYYLKSGDISKERIYANKKISQEINYKNNTVIKEVFYFDDGVQREVIKYNEVGSIIKHLKRDSNNELWKIII